jgi:hypothetical protein
MINKFVKLQFDLSLAGFAYGIGYIFISLFYIISILFPPMKKILKEFEKTGSRKSIGIISLLSGCILYLLFYYIVLNSSIDKASLLESIIWFLLYIGGGYFALYLLYDYKKNKTIFS